MPSVDARDVDTDDEEEEYDDETFFEWLSDHMKNSAQIKAVRKYSYQAFSTGRWSLGMAGKALWFLTSSAIMVGVPLSLASELERGQLEQMQAMGGDPGASGPVAPM